jgi:hypothetical protein
VTSGPNVSAKALRARLFTPSRGDHEVVLIELADIEHTSRSNCRSLRGSERVTQ